jgi:hypothetical protein
MLAKHNIEQASYWNIHNNITEQGGDYGYLSRIKAPDGIMSPAIILGILDGEQDIGTGIFTGVYKQRSAC